MSMIIKINQGDTQVSVITHKHCSTYFCYFHCCLYNKYISISCGMGNLTMFVVLWYDTTSRVSDIGKAVGLKVLKENKVFNGKAEVFLNVNSSKAQVIVVGEKKRKPEKDNLDS